MAIVERSDRPVRVVVSLCPVDCDYCHEHQWRQSSTGYTEASAEPPRHL